MPTLEERRRGEAGEAGVGWRMEVPPRQRRKYNYKSNRKTRIMSSLLSNLI